MRAILLLVTVVIIALIVYTLTLEKTRDIATLKVLGAADRTIAGLILQEALGLGLLGFALGAAIISQTYQYFPRRVVVVAFDQYVLLAIVVAICIAGGLLGVWQALRVDPTVALGGGA
jgi:putative ABC transport system permease protein